MSIWVAISVTRVRSQGRMRISFNVVTRDLARFGYNNHNADAGNTACTRPSQ